MLEINQLRQEVLLNGSKIRLPAVEYKILLALKTSGITLSREQINRDILGKEYKSRAVDTHVCRIRRKLGDVIETVPKYGYKIALS